MLCLVVLCYVFLSFLFFCLLLQSHLFSPLTTTTLSTYLLLTTTAYYLPPPTPRQAGVCTVHVRTLYTMTTSLLNASYTPRNQCLTLANIADHLLPTHTCYLFKGLLNDCFLNLFIRIGIYYSNCLLLHG